MYIEKMKQETNLGSKKLVFNFFWCFWLTLLLRLQYTTALAETSTDAIAGFIGAFIGAFVDNFFIFFFWSWKPEHVRYAIVRKVIHFMFFLLSSSIACLFLISGGTNLKEFSNIFLLIFFTLLQFFTTAKYLKIMWGINIWKLQG